MKRRHVFVLAACACTVLPMLAAVSATAQTVKDQVVGTWTLASGIEKRSDGTTAPTWAAGNLVLTATGHVSLFLIGKDRAKADADPRVPIGPLVAYYGTYTVDEATKTMTYSVEMGSSPAWEKMVRKQTVSMTGDAMTLTGSPVKLPQGDIVPINEWKRTK